MHWLLQCELLLLAKHVNRAQYLFKSDRFSLMVFVPNISTPQCVNGGTSRHLTLGKSSISCKPNVPRSLQELTRLCIILDTTMLALSIQNPFCLKLFKIIPLPAWATFPWHHRIIASDICFVSEEPNGKLRYERVCISPI